MMALAPLEIQAGMAFLTSISDIWIRRLRRPMVSTVHQENMNMAQEAICHHPRLCYNSHQESPQLLHVLGQDPKAYKNN